jgi:3-hydroxymyristoyl/3-hydroxydecanoyl-(acyl carrier protein) dehydratase
MTPDELAPILRKLRRTPLTPLSAPAESPRARTEIEGFIPHRGSMLLLDCIDHVDASVQALRARRRIDLTDPVFAGHFPDNPVYPGVLLVEMMGQAGLCLLPLLHEHRSAHVARLTHVHHATFLAPVLPGMEVTVLAALVDESLTLTAVGQIYHGETLCAFAASEVYVDE